MFYINNIILAKVTIKGLKQTKIILNKIIANITTICIIHNYIYAIVGNKTIYTIHSISLKEIGLNIASIP